MKKQVSKTPALIVALLFAAFPVVFPGCTASDSEPPADLPQLDPAEKKAAADAELESEKAGIDVPAAAGIAAGDVKNVRQYVDRVTEANERNNEKARSGDWNYSRPAVGGDDARY